MTLTAARPGAVEAPVTTPRPAPAPSLSASDHKRVGLWYLYASLAFLLVGGGLAVWLRLELASPARSLGDSFEPVFSMHATVTTLLFLPPLWLGLATYLVPLQIGATGLAFPRLQSLSFWLFLVGGVLLVASYLLGDPPGLGLSRQTPLEAAAGGADDATNLWVLSLSVVGLASVLGAVNLVTSIVALRAEGLVLLRMPAFTWSVLATNSIVLLAGPVFLGGLLLLYLDQHFGGSLFSGGAGGAAVWRHTLWLFGRPEVFLLTLPGLGALCDIVAVHARHPLLGARVAAYALCTFAALSLGAWMTGPASTRAVVLPTATLVTAAVAVPLVVLVALALGTLRLGRPRLHPSLLFVGGAVLLWLFGAANVAVAALAGVNRGSAWTVAHVHVVAFAAPTLLAFAAVHHWAPKLWGRHLLNGPSLVGLFLLWGGFLLAGLAGYLLGYDEMPAHVASYASEEGWTGLNRLATAGGVVTGLGAVVLVATVVAAATGRGPTAAGDPYEGQTLEWATTSPPPPYNFERLPEVRSAHPLTDLGAGERAPGRGG